MLAQSSRRLRKFVCAAGINLYRDSQQATWMAGINPAMTKGAKMNSLPNSFRTGPDERGHFGMFGGRFVAETLMPLILELEKAYARGQGRPGVPGARWTAICKHYVGRPSPLYFAERLTSIFGISWPRPGRRQDLLQARGAQPHRRAQDQQRARPDPAGQAHGQDAHHRRDRRRPARRRDRDASAPASASTASSSWARSTSARQKPNVFRMKLLGAEVVPVTVRRPDAEGRA